MQFFIALGLLVAAATVYLLTQFLRRSLTDDATPENVEEPETESTLRAA